MKKRQEQEHSNNNFIKCSTMLICLLTIFNQVNINECAVMQAIIDIDSDNVDMKTFLDKFKQFIRSSHTHKGTSETTSTEQKIVNHDDSFQASYDFAKNLLSIGNSYSVLQNKTNDSSIVNMTKVTDIKITINFLFRPDINEGITLRDYDGSAPMIGLETSSQENEKTTTKQADSSIHFDQKNFQDEETTIKVETTFLAMLISPLIYTIEPVVIAFIHIVINGVLGHVLTNAFDQLYNGSFAL